MVVTEGSSLFDALSGAELSEDDIYRWTLWRRWDLSKPDGILIGVNPSTADQIVPDPTVTRTCVRFQRLGLGGLIVLNLFAIRSPDRTIIYRHPDPVGGENDRKICDTLSAAMAKCAPGTKPFVLCGWGVEGRHRGRDEVVLGVLRSRGIVPHCLGLNKDGTPTHPLYKGYGVSPIQF
ncbi:DUF1643 domain-containing protein [Burkholderia vietnamiensis]|uniref:DUF1643 domain-containing protein n=1 Tax=Burkholderia vietnamiensis TaxID=60552 RepID=UPI001BA16038|nr:DUF1643 domain-containing protein [Burkholderia vietnamiensis]MBR8189203.1 DUF1643 domain-containing protein [Burkholderia vietnamiensis]HDR9174410.1 DUF1643 domain-containing protein [Burkholderia vietnamiensis]